jgi:hypothetical protein
VEVAPYDNSGSHWTVQNNWTNTIGFWETNTGAGTVVTIYIDDITADWTTGAVGGWTKIDEVSPFPRDDKQHRVEIGWVPPTSWHIMMDGNSAPVITSPDSVGTAMINKIGFSTGTSYINTDVYINNLDYNWSPKTETISVNLQRIKPYKPKLELFGSSYIYMDGMFIGDTYGIF